MVYLDGHQHLSWLCNHPSVGLGKRQGGHATRPQTLQWLLPVITWHETCSQRYPVGADRMSLARKGGSMPFVWKMERQEVDSFDPLST